MKSVTAAFVAAIAASATAQGALVISEVLYNEVGGSYLGEWIEIYNSSNTTIDLSNYKIGDEETSGQTGNTEGLFQFPAGASIAPGEVQIVASGAVRFAEVYSFKPTYEVSFAGDAATPATDDPTVANMVVYATWDSDGDRLNMSNSNDQALLVGPSDTVIDAVSWGGTFAFNPGLVATVQDGQSYERVNASIDTNSAGDWQLGSLSSPGTVVVPEPASLMGLALLAAFRRNR